MFLPWASSCSHSRFSLSTAEFRSPSHGGNLNRSASLSCTERTPECGSVGGSVTQIPGTPFQYIPDFCVRALTDLQFVKVAYLLAVSRRCWVLSVSVASGVTGHTSQNCCMALSSGHSCSVPERPSGVQAGQHAAVTGGRSHPPRHVRVSAARDAAGDPQPAAAGHASCGAPGFEHSSSERPPLPSPDDLFLGRQSQPVCASGSAPSQQPRPSLPDLFFYGERGGRWQQPPTLPDLLPLLQVPAAPGLGRRARGEHRPARRAAELHGPARA